ncbi:MAG: hypothetical protein SFX72_01810 [Isosphaeraceae bacterium]|nr:hypothetical protein [Isosphaeraceae bacterium]
MAKIPMASSTSAVESLASAEPVRLEAVEGDEPPVTNRVLANRLNAKRSTGPRTPEGKANSRKNALIHGLTGKGVVLPAEVAAKAEERKKSWVATYRPVNSTETDAIVAAAIAMTQLEHAFHAEQAARTRALIRAETGWDADRDAAAGRLGAKLHLDPPAILPQLRQSAHGAAWLVERWRELLLPLELGEDWDAISRKSALDLLGVSRAVRNLRTVVDPPPGASPAATIQQRTRIVIEEIEKLEMFIDRVLLDLDESDRALALANLRVVPDSETEKTMRYQSRLSRQLSAGLNRFHALRRHADANDPQNGETKPTEDQAPTAPGAPAVVSPPPPPADRPALVVEKPRENRACVKLPVMSVPPPAPRRDEHAGRPRVTSVRDLLADEPPSTIHPGIARVNQLVESIIARRLTAASSVGDAEKPFDPPPDRLTT